MFFFPSQIELLLRDEIVSALRLMSPIRSDALEFVTQHVQALSGKPNASTETVPLQFVYGPEHSMSKFIEVCVTVIYHQLTLCMLSKFGCFLSSADCFFK